MRPARHGWAYDSTAGHGCDPRPLAVLLAGAVLLLVPPQLPTVPVAVMALGLVLAVAAPGRIGVHPHAVVQAKTNPAMAIAG